MNERLILIQSFFDPPIAVVLENNEILNVFIDIDSQDIGSIYKGKIINIQKGINACFVALGSGKYGFLNLNDIPANIDPKVGYFLMVKIKKTSVKYKAPQLSGYVTIAGKYLVLLPFENSIKISHKIENKETEEILRIKLENIKERISSKYPDIKNLGFIARTNSQYADAIELQKEIEILYKIWQKILQEYNSAKHEKLLYKDDFFPIRIIREYFDNKTRVIVDNKNYYEEIKKYMLNFLSNYVNSLSFFDVNKSHKGLLEYYNIKLDFQDFIKNKINLVNGGYLVVHHTELGTVIDVNSGSYIGLNPYETYKNVNLNSLSEIVKLIRIRDISGIILIDFLKVQEEEKKQEINKKIIEELEKLFKEEKRRIKIWGFTNLGILEITRQRIEEGNYNKISSVCKYCQGSGYVLSPEYQVVQIINTINSYIIKLAGTKEKLIYLEISSEIIPYFIEKYILGEYYKYLQDYGFSFVVKSYHSYYYMNKYSKYKIRVLKEIESDIISDFPSVGDVLDTEAWMIQELDSKKMYSLYKGFPLVITSDFEAPFEGIKKVKAQVTKLMPYYYIESKKI